MLGQKKTELSGKQKSPFCLPGQTFGLAEVRSLIDGLATFLTIKKRICKKSTRPLTNFDKQSPD
ncbi:hypothetical protein EH221_00960 [bacterium]|nr:MAG: hypothetical protein EH221_00960 [bacterium]